MKTLALTILLMTFSITIGLTGYSYLGYGDLSWVVGGTRVFTGE